LSWQGSGFRKYFGSDVLRAFGIEPREHVIGGGFHPWPEALFGKFFGGRQWAVGGVDLDQGLVGGGRFSVFSASGSVDS
jgi:hypothetical protein